MKFSLGPLQYCWDKPAVEAFYQAAANSHIPLIYLGETVCSKRRKLRFGDYLALAQMLRDAGKSVVISTLALIESRSEITELKKQLENGEFMVEANDMGTVALASQLQLPFVCGPSINNYNLTSLNKLASWGMQRFVMPVDLSKKWLSTITEQQPQFEIEVLGYGYLPLAHSARCFTARHHGLNKDNCDTICANYQRGLLSQTLEHQPLLRLNGIQTQSAACMDLRNEIPQMEQLGVDWFRVSPDSIASVAFTDALIQGERSQSQHQLTCNGYWHDAAGMSHI